MAIGGREQTTELARPAPRSPTYLPNVTYMSIEQFEKRYGHGR